MLQMSWGHRVRPTPRQRPRLVSGIDIFGTPADTLVEKLREHTSVDIDEDGLPPPRPTCCSLCGERWFLRTTTTQTAGTSSLSSPQCRATTRKQPCPARPSAEGTAPGALKTADQHRAGRLPRTRPHPWRRTHGRGHRVGQRRYPRRTHRTHHAQPHLEAGQVFTEAAWRRQGMQIGAVWCRPA